MCTDLDIHIRRLSLVPMKPKAFPHDTLRSASSRNMSEGISALFLVPSLAMEAVNTPARGQPLPSTRV